MQPYENAIFTHNHPRGWKVPENSIARIGNSFSIEDLSLAVGHDAAEIRAVTPNYTFVMRRPEKGWGVSLKEFQATYMKENAKLKKEFTQRINAGTLTFAQANSTHFHLLARRIAKNLIGNISKERHVNPLARIGYFPPGQAV